MKVTKIETNFNRGLFWETSQAKFNGRLKNQEKELINLYPDTTFQSVIGFGGAFTESAGYCFSLVDAATRDQILDAYFSPHGLNYHFCRIPIGSCDFSLSSYSYLENADIRTFSIEQDKKYVIPFIQKALRRNPHIRFLASPWSPPKFMKDSHRLSLGGRLRKKYYDLYAAYLTQFILAYQTCGIPIHYITIQNEPNATQTWESCIYSAEDEAVFAKNHLLPAFQRSGISTQILAWDHNKERLYLRSQNVFSTAGNAVSGMAMHWYSGDYFEEIALTRTKFPDKLLFHTEGCTGYSHFREADEVKNAEIYGHDILGDLQAGIHGFIDWNLILDYHGGPNHKQNYCNAPIMLDQDSAGYRKNLTYYYIGHFSRWIQPGAKRIGLSRFTTAIEATAFRNPDGSLALVLLNRNDVSAEYNVNLNGSILHDNLDSHAIVSFVIRP